MRRRDLAPSGACIDTETVGALHTSDKRRRIAYRIDPADSISHISSLQPYLGAATSFLPSVPRCGRHPSTSSIAPSKIDRLKRADRRADCNGLPLMATRVRNSSSYVERWSTSLPQGIPHGTHSLQQATVRPAQRCECRNREKDTSSPTHRFISRRRCACSSDARGIASIYGNTTRTSAWFTRLRVPYW